MLDLASGGCSSARSARKRFRRGRFPLNLDQDATGLVPHKAGQPAARREPEHKGPESDPLDDAANHDGPTFHDVDPVRIGQPAGVSAERFCTSDPAIVTAACSRDQRVTQRQVGCRVVIGRSNLKGLAQKDQTARGQRPERRPRCQVRDSTVQRKCSSFHMLSGPRS